MNGKQNLIALIALVCAIWFTISSVYLQIIRTDLDIIHDALSLYAIGKAGFILETGFYSIGFTQILMAFILFKNDVRRKYSAIALSLAGVGVIIVGVIPTQLEPVDFIVKLPHIVGATMQFVFFPVAVLLLSKYLSSGGIRYYTISTGLLTAVLFSLILVLFFVPSIIEIDFFGLVEKLEIYIINLWLIIVSWKFSWPDDLHSVSTNENK